MPTWLAHFLGGFIPQKRCSYTTTKTDGSMLYLYRWRNESKLPGKLTFFGVSIMNIPILQIAQDEGKQGKRYMRFYIRKN